MSIKHSRDAATPMPQGAEDFKLIRGIGPGVASRLHGAGILTFAQLAALPTTEIAGLLSDLAGLSVERIAKQNWSGQARDLAAELSASELQNDITAEPSRQHYATFTVELLLGEGNDVRRSHVVHIQQGIEDTWAGWDDSRLVDFFIKQAELRSAQAEKMPVARVEDELAPAIKPILTIVDQDLAAVIDDQVEEKERLDLRTEPLGIDPQRELIEVGANTTETTIAQSVMSAASFGAAEAGSLPTYIGGVLRLRDLSAISSEQMLPPSFLRGSKPFSVRLTLDLTEVAAPSAEALEYQASIYAKSIGGSRQIVGQTYGTLLRTDRVAIDVESIGLQSGTYRLEAVVSIDRQSYAARTRPGLRAMLESSLIQVC